MTLNKKLGAALLLASITFVFHAEIEASVYALFGETPQAITTEQERLLRAVIPQADTFSPKEGDPPHYKAYKVDRGSGARTLVGLAFLTIDVEPLERGYEGPIQMLVGLDTKGAITSIRVLEHHEPYGYFSIDRRAFVAQFEGKSILDRFRVGRDIDAVSRATITINSATRVIRKSARVIARQYLAEEQDRQ